LLALLLFIDFLHIYRCSIACFMLFALLQYLSFDYYSVSLKVVLCTVVMIINKIELLLYLSYLREDFCYLSLW
jgi:hypothetical protein